MRLFTAVELPEAVREAVRAAYDERIAPLIAQAGRAARDPPDPRAERRSDGEAPHGFSDPRTVRAVASENLHVTVRFLGDVPPERLPAVRAALAAAGAQVPSAGPIVRVRGFGAFPPGRAPRVLWAGIDDPAGTIAALESTVSARLAPLGFPREDRPYAPHVTVARVAEERRRGRRGRRPGLSAALALPPDADLGPLFPVRELSLLSSELSQRGPRYRVLDRFPLTSIPLRTPEE